MSKPIKTTDIRNASSSFAGYEAPDIFEQMQRQEHEAARQARLERLSSMYLYDKEGFDRTEIDADPMDRMTMGVRHNTDEFHMLMGDEIAHIMGKKAQDAAEYLITTLPDEEQGQFKQDLEYCISRSDVNRVVSRIMEHKALQRYKEKQKKLDALKLREQYKANLQFQPTVESTPFYYSWVNWAKDYNRIADWHLVATYLIGAVVFIRVMREIFAKTKTSYLPHIIAILLLLAIDMPYGYYQFLRLSVTAYAGYSFYSHLQRESRHRELHLILSAALVLLYQPFFPLALGREIWQWVNLASVVAVYGVRLKVSSRG